MPQINCLYVRSSLLDGKRKNAANATKLQHLVWGKYTCDNSNIISLVNVYFLAELELLPGSNLSLPHL